MEVISVILSLGGAGGELHVWACMQCILDLGAWWQKRREERGGGAVSYL